MFSIDLGLFLITENRHLAATSQLSLFYAKNTEWVHAFFVSQKKYLAAISQLSLMRVHLRLLLLFEVNPLLF